MTEETLFQGALEQPAGERAAFLDKLCGDDIALRQRVAALLQAHDHPGDFLAQPPVPQEPTVDEPRLAERPGSRIGPYKLLQQIGEGGMGVVFMAEQVEPVQRRVALKVIKPGMDSHQVIVRFEAERQALALMDHPNIARVLDAGTTGVSKPEAVARDAASLATASGSEGRPYFVMELVKGVPITKYCDAHRLTPRQRLELFIPVCQAVQHAHQKGIIHRDLKPSNVLIASYDGKPVPKVIDFGVAKATGQKLTDKTLFTDFGAVVGTLEYMSPEQAELNQLDIDTRSDVYALGVLLYELLTGTTPLSRKRLKEAAFLECLRIIREEEPPKPSTRLSTTQELVVVAANRSLEPKKLTGAVSGDLDWIVMKCLEKDRNRRYETTNGLALDVQRYLADEPVLACPPSAAYRLRKFGRRHKAGLRTTAAVVSFVLLVVGGIGWALWDRVAQKAERSAETERAVSVALAKADQSAARAGQQRSTTTAAVQAALADWREAAAALAEAEAALTTGTGTDTVRERVAAMGQRIEAGRLQALRKQKLFSDLDDARMASAVWGNNDFDFAGAAAKYAAAFAAYGLDAAADDKDEFLRRLASEAPEVREALLVALDDWAYCARSGPPAVCVKLGALAQAADTDVWRRQYRTAVSANDRAALRALSAEARRLSLPSSSLVLLARDLDFLGEHDEALALRRWAHGVYPTDFWISYELGGYLHVEKGRGTPAEVEEAIGCYRAALALRPTIGPLHNDLGSALTAKNQLDEAIAEFRKAIALDPKIAVAHNNLGFALTGKNELDAAIAEFHKAIALDPKMATAHVGLGTALQYKNQLDGAVAELRKAVELNPKLAIAYNNLGNALEAKQQGDDAFAEYEKAIDVDPTYAEAHYNLGNVLHNKHQLDAAVAEYRKAIDLRPNYALAHYALGSTLYLKNQLDEAITEFHKAIDLDPQFAQAHGGLGQALMQKGRFAEAKAATQRAIDLLPEKHELRSAGLQQRADCDRLLAVEAKLADVLLGKRSSADDSERGDFFTVCQLQQRHGALVKLYRAAFAADPTYADNVNAGHRYHAAGYAALAAAGQGTVADKLDYDERARLRQQALIWLRADKDVWAKQLESTKAEDRVAAQEKLRSWQKDVTLAGLRDKDDLAKLPPDERAVCQKFWAEVAELLKNAAATK